MKREIITTNDGSKTIHIPEWNEQYHSKHGAINEAKHVYLNEGLAYFIDQYYSETTNPISILEIGFGTGLNAYLTYLYAEHNRKLIHYNAVEAFPISKDELLALNYKTKLQDNTDRFNAIHDCAWESYSSISNFFSLKKQNLLFKDIKETETHHVIYFDAFGPRVQPELWTEAIFKIMYEALKPNGVLVTYCAQGDARRAMIASGFKVSKVDGPPGKRHMLRAIK